MNDISSTVVNEHSYECTITVDCAVFGFQDGVVKLLLVKRSVEPFKDKWMLPGGIMGPEDSLEEAVGKVLYNLTDIDNVHYEQLKVYSRVDRHPIKRVLTVAFYALVKPENHPVIAKKHVAEVNWFPLNDVPQLGFDHDEISKDAWRRLKTNVEEKFLFGELLPQQFTLKELQDLYESIMGQELDRRNFRKKILQSKLIRSTGVKKKGVKGGPELFEIIE
ncbi:NUDIX domain-containing protein [Marinoscillum sp. MHG1-6]|uniref:NUDIX hydrolase n=1 Tax=Marinoscillum sp. MHG1-6 TaxID=2959627 RepID=UPI002157413A|nr:NUDIX domain-containing protein [Marinoscillum sp. MHG1-6]